MPVDPDLAYSLAMATVRVKEALHGRNALIRRAHAEGAEVAEIARAAGLSPTGVETILERGQARPPLLSEHVDLRPTGTEQP